MPSKRSHPHGPEDHKPKQDPSAKAENRRKANREDEDNSPVDKSLSNRSARSIVAGGENEERGEPPPGYGTEAPQVQGGGKR